MNWKKTVKLKNLRHIFKNPNFEFKDELKNAMSQFEFHFWKSREFT